MHEPSLCLKLLIKSHQQTSTTNVHCLYGQTTVPARSCTPLPVLGCLCIYICKHHGNFMECLDKHRKLTIHIYIHTSLYVPSYPHQNLMISPSFFHHIPIFVDHSPIESHPHPGNFFPLTLTTASCPLAAAK